MDQKLIDGFFNTFQNDEKINLIKSKLGTFKNSAFEPNEQFKAYLEYKQKYDDACLNVEQVKKRAEQNEIKAIHQLNVSGPLLFKMVDMALQSWITLGYKYEVEKIINKINS